MFLPSLARAAASAARIFARAGMVAGVFAARAAAVRAVASQVVAQSLRRLAKQARSVQRDMQQIKPPQILVHDNIRDSQRWLGDHNAAIKKATLKALTRTSRRLIPIMESEVERAFDKPKKFTVKAFGNTVANPATMSTTLFIKDRQAAYLLPNIKGGKRGQKGFEKKLASDAGVDAYWVPGQGTKLNAAGNMTLAQIKAIASKLRESGKYGEVFVGIPQGHHGAPFGIWARPKRNAKPRKGATTVGNIKPLLIRVQQPSYQRRFDFYGIAERHAGRIFNEEFSRAFAEEKARIKPATKFEWRR